MIGLWHFLAVGAVLFGLGLTGLLTRRNLITMFLCAELMVQGVALNFAAFGRLHGQLEGQLFVIFLVAVAAAEAAIALGLFLTVYRQARSLDVSLWQQVREDGVEATVDTEPLPAERSRPDLLEGVQLPPAGRRPRFQPEEGVIRV
ncbi:MAG: NADH-quinone oxidoreductase subunit NuoK [Gemmataceae bacterium]|nr:NADH-quinone oxidoreductase subunit NuoK [Gemmataceae bacterium]MCS7272357.1 NADH-quinone oxidoreductase subunit NuoK [Gemmataceae bacterium]MDW8243086.1 NADH-quinone oxidoreductase subunit NuoK [Thermogemmata sp.]